MEAMKDRDRTNTMKGSLDEERDEHTTKLVENMRRTLGVQVSRLCRASAWYSMNRQLLLRGLSWASQLGSSQLLSSYTGRK